MKTILITGTSSGIGRAAALKFQREGWNVVATMRGPEKETELNRLENVLVAKLDVQNLESIDSAIKAGIERFGGIDTLVNNAGFSVFGAFEMTYDDQLHKIFDINLFGPMQIIKSILPHFRENKSGAIINITSMGGLH
ncbi:SDR family NAD(P)-dependent oxidoreductase [Pedobacter antarcticus]|uniref:SDR family NAD(P)-dependent oxidoreductase n=1 Tax=Pedobacter antarcticus TaxID=34086 RepID=UPI000890892B|nr:SDR family NAD(P)-dependent oxidoreductase [Pedobacter antarcticus]SDM31326.1 short chain dehydrogenase [Pedobacter antarcticus]